eukprot:TRINITY_DN2654_c0_g3_i4.p1 TRINITY_DN2654_c0_g3~~TRINITY_DN2654_c0_g3_i4.p1  ORF type:complete len:494 (+),score=119.15 TRINITY_DN2654_c0_g3_i4:84-1484(+)
MADIQKACAKEMNTEQLTLVVEMGKVDKNWGLNDGQLFNTIDLFQQSFMFAATNTFEVFAEDNSTYVTTGDIGEMWLRDSCYELLPYLQAVKRRPKGTYPNTQIVIESAMHRMASFINTDIYGSAFTLTHSSTDGPSIGECPPSVDCPWCTCTQCAPACGNYTFQRDFELDSVVHVMLFYYQYYNATGIVTHAQSPVFRTAVTKIINLLNTEMYHESKSPYVFDRPDGCKVKDGVGLVWSYARPSDDAASGGYSIPDNMMLVVVIKKFVVLLSAAGGFDAEITSFNSIAQTVEAAIENLGVMQDSSGAKVYAFEVDGFGNQTLMDDANLPNLLWLPYLGYPDHLQLYNNTRAFVLSHDDLNYFSGSFATGLGSQHHSFGLRGHNPGPQCTGNCIWHLGLVMEALTSPDRSVKRDKLNQIITTLARQSLLHEGFSPDDPDEYNRDWFGWADAMYCIMITTDWLTYNG